VIALALLILTLATYRVTRLVVKDAITEPLRRRTTERLNPDSKLRELLECPWCVGFWLSCAAVGLFALAPVTVTWLALPLAISAVVGVLASHEVA
jgi:hypothetical protein